jgi:hypothetical protein
MTKSMASALQDLELEHLWVVYPGDREYALHKKIMVIPLETTKNFNAEAFLSRTGGPSFSG